LVVISHDGHSIKHLDVLLELDFIERIPDTYPQRYRTIDSDVTNELFELNSAINPIGDG
jgi:hypothetical protein